MSTVAGKVAVVTGAGSGIGRALAVELAQRGARLAISDIDPEGLAGTAAELERARSRPHHQVLDVADGEAFAAYAETVAGHHGVVHQLYNNAGIALRRPVLETETADYERVLGVNLWGVIHGTTAFLPHLIASGEGHLVNVSSLNGYMGQAGMTHYCASKFAVRGFSESLRIELAAAGQPVRVTVVHPGGVRTNIATAAMSSARERGVPISEDDEARFRIYNEKLLRMDPARAARIIADGVEADRPRILVGRDARLVDLIVRALPARYPQLAAAIERRAARGR